MRTNQQPSQANKILARLKSAQGRWVTMPGLSAISGAYAVHSRVAELRKRGHRIENRIEQRDNGTRLSLYRLVES